MLVFSFLRTITNKIYGFSATISFLHKFYKKYLRTKIILLYICKNDFSMPNKILTLTLIYKNSQ